MARVAFPSYDVQTVAGRGGGVGTFIKHLARRLQADGDDVAIIHTTGAPSPVRIDQKWRDIYRSWGIEVIEVHNTPWSPQRWPDVWTMRLSEQLAPILRSFDVAYFADWGNTAFHTVRQKRFATTPMPTCVTVLHGPSTWVRWGDRENPAIPDHLNLEFVERYAAEHSDFVVAPSHCIVDYVEREGWKFRRPPEVLGLPFWPDHFPEDRPQVAEIRRVVFFGRLEKRKGYDTFTKALAQLAAKWPEALRCVDEIVFLGEELAQGSAGWVRQELSTIGRPVTHIGNYDSDQANEYLREHVADALVVVPSPHENFPYAVIEASLIPGLNLICTRGGGTPEIFAGQGQAQLFHPTPEALAACLRERLQQPLGADQLARYDFAAANDRWLSFHDRVRKAAALTCACRPTVAIGDARPAVDVCITYFNKGHYLSQLCLALTHQTAQNFRVIAVDDGSTDPASVEIFDTLADQYAPRGWIFFRQPNLFVDAARNAAAARADADYLLMLDSDDMLAPNAIERMLAAAQISGDDCLVTGTCFFSGDDPPFDPDSGELTVSPEVWAMPLGPSLVAGMIDPSVFGGPAILIRRRVFETVGGYRELRDAAHEDWELHARLAFDGYRTDVIPEYLHFHRQVADSLSQHADRFVAKRRMIDAYDRTFAKVGLHGTANAMWSLYCKTQELESRTRDLEARLRSAEDRRREFDACLRVPGYAPDSLPAEMVGDRAAATAPPDAPAPSVRLGKAALQVRPTKVLIVIPTLGIGGAEMDVVRNVPRIDRSRFDITVCTFLARDELAQKLIDQGINIAGPDFPPPSPGAFRRFLRFCRATVSGSVSRASAVARRGLANLAARLPPPLRQVLVPLGHRTVRRLHRAANAARRVTGRWYYGVPIIPLPAVKHFIVAARTYLRLARPISDYIQCEDFEIIHAILPNAYFIAAACNLLRRRRHLVMSRLSLNFYQRHDRILGIVERLALHRLVDIAIGNSSAILQQLRSEGIPESRLRLLHNGIDVPEFLARTTSRDQARQLLGVTRQALVLSCIANLYPYKGHIDLLHALHQAAPGLPSDWLLLAAGRDVDGNLGKLRHVCTELDLGRNVRFLGERNDIPIILSAADIHVSASHHEGFPNNILEAMCVGLPVVATAVGGVPELVQDTRTGLLVPPGDAARMAAALRSLADDCDRRRSMGEAGRARVMEKFTIEHSVRTYEAIYGELANGTSASTTPVAVRDEADQSRPRTPHRLENASIARP